MVKFLDEHKILLETLVPSDWTWGCELEGFISESDYEDITGDTPERDYYGDLEPNHEKLCDYFDNIIRKRCKNCDDSNSDVHDDGSLHPDDGELSFEYSTPVFKTLPSEYNGFCKFLEEILNDGFYTTDDCGFHHHLMYKYQQHFLHHLKHQQFFHLFLHQYEDLLI